MRRRLCWAIKFAVIILCLLVFATRKFYLFPLCPPSLLSILLWLKIRARRSNTCESLRHTYFSVCAWSCTREIILFQAENRDKWREMFNKVPSKWNIRGQDGGICSSAIRPVSLKPSCRLHPTLVFIKISHAPRNAASLNNGAAATRVVRQWNRRRCCFAVDVITNTISQTFPREREILALIMLPSRVSRRNTSLEYIRHL